MKTRAVSSCLMLEASVGCSETWLIKQKKKRIIAENGCGGRLRRKVVRRRLEMEEKKESEKRW